MDEIYDENGVLLTAEPDLTLGEIVMDKKIVHHEAVPSIPEEGHYEVIAEYSNGGKDLLWVVDRPASFPVDAWDEEIPILVYHAYTPKELEAMEASRSLQEQIHALQEKNDMLESCILEMSELLYA